MSKVYAYSRTMAGIQRLAEQRGLPALTFDEPKPERPPVAAPLAIAPPAEPVTGNVVAVNFKPRTKAQQIIADIAHQHGLTYADIMGRSRADRIVAARHDAIAAVYLNCRIEGRHYSRPKLGQIFGLDHTTCLYALRKRGLA